MGWLLACGPTGPLDSPASSSSLLLDTPCLLSHFHPQGPKLIHSWRVGHRAYVHAVLSAWSGLHVTKLKPLMLGLRLNIAFSSKTPLSASSFSVSTCLLVQNSKENYLLLCLSSEFLSSSPSLKVGSPSEEARPLLEVVEAPSRPTGLSYGMNECMPYAIPRGNLVSASHVITSSIWCSLFLPHPIHSTKFSPGHFGGPSF